VRPEDRLRDRGERRERPAREDVRRDQRADRDPALGDEVDPPDDEHDAHPLLDQLRAVGGEARPDPRPPADARGGGDRGLPFALHHGFGVQALDRLDAEQRLDQHDMPLRRELLRLRGAPAERDLRHDGEEEDDRNREERDPGEGAHDVEEHGDEDADEDEVDERHEAGRAEEVAHLFEVSDRVRHAGRAAGPGRHARGERLVEDGARHLQVDPPRDGLEHAGSERPEREVEHQRDPHAEGERPERHERRIRDHPVVDVHHEDRHGEREQVDAERRRDHLRPRGPVLPHRPPEPVPGAAAEGSGLGRAPRLGPVHSGRDKEERCGHHPFEVAARHRRLRPVGRVDEGRHAAVVGQAVEDAWRAVAAEDDGGQGGRIDVGGPRRKETSAQADMRQSLRHGLRPFERRARRHPRAERRLRERPAVEPGEPADQRDPRVKRRTGGGGGRRSGLRRLGHLPSHSSAGIAVLKTERGSASARLSKSAENGMFAGATPKCSARRLSTASRR
jgi:hypothetical protein